MLLTRQAVVLAEIDVTYGTDPTPTGAANAILTTQPQIKLLTDKVERNFVKPTLSPLAPALAGEIFEVSFDTELVGSGAAGTPPVFGPLLRACGLSETIAAGTSVTYAPVSTAFESATIYVYLDGILHKLISCRGDVSLNAEVGKYAILSWRMQAKYVAPVDIAMATPTYASVTPPRCLSATLTLGGDTIVATKLALAMNNELFRRDDFNEVTGVKTIEIGGRKPNGSLDPETPLLAAKNYWTEFYTREAQALSMVIGASAGNICTITAPKCVYDDVSYGERGPARIYNVPFTCQYNSGDDEVSFAFT